MLTIKDGLPCIWPALQPFTYTQLLLDSILNNGLERNRRHPSATVATQLAPMYYCVRNIMFPYCIKLSRTMGYMNSIYNNVHNQHFTPFFLYLHAELAKTSNLTGGNFHFHFQTGDMACMHFFFCVNNTALGSTSHKTFYICMQNEQKLAIWLKGILIFTFRYEICP